MCVWRNVRPVRELEASYDKGRKHLSDYRDYSSEHPIYDSGPVEAICSGFLREREAVQISKITRVIGVEDMERAIDTAPLSSAEHEPLS